MKERSNLRGMRLKRKLTQQEIAKISGIERSRYSRIENGSIKRVSIKDAFALANVFGCTVEDIFCSEDVY